jgi:prepilin-type N-terminal cleavage/methylation domain-containing protein
MLLMMKQQRMRPLGFTLIELMIVIAIIGILATWAIPSYMQYTMRTARFDGQALASQVLVAAQTYYQKHATYPADIATLTGNTGSTGLTSENGHFTIVTGACGSTPITRCLQVSLTPASALAEKLACRLTNSSAGTGCATNLQMWVRTTGETSSHWRKAI